MYMFMHLYVNTLSHLMLTTCEMGIIISILYVMKLRQREVKLFSELGDEPTWPVLFPLLRIFIGLCTPTALP